MADAGRDTGEDNPDKIKRGINTFVKRRVGTSDAVRKLTGKARVPATESISPVYDRIKENRAAHYKSATPAQKWTDAEGSNKGAQDMRKQHDPVLPANVNEPDVDKKNFQGMAGKTPNAKPRPNDNKAGDKKIINPVQDVTKAASKKEDDGFKDQTTAQKLSNQ